MAEQKMGSRGSIDQAESRYNFTGFNISSDRKISSRKFTGVYCLYAATVFKGSDIHVSLAEFKIREGNFAFYVVFDGKVVGKVEPEDGGYSEFLLENVDKTGDLEYIIAGESACFPFIAPLEIE